MKKKLKKKHYISPKATPLAEEALRVASQRYAVGARSGGQAQLPFFS